MEKSKIIANIASLTAETLFEYINQGIVKLAELQATGDLDATKRKKIAEMQAQIDKKDEEAWERARYGGEMALIDYITNFPTGKYVQEAKDRLDFLAEERKRNQAKKQGILNSIKRNPNTFSPSEIKDHLVNGTITEQELMDECNIPQCAIENLDKVQKPNLVLGNTPDSIPAGYTEVYFWGGTGSGKTCALGAVLQMAERKGYLNIATGPGYLYANQLKNIFNHDGKANDYLPAPSPVETTQYLPFTLKCPKEKASRSVSLIELSGEIFKCFFLENANQPLPTQDHVNTFNSLNAFLKSSNRKIHFFFIDYDRDNRPDNFGLKQSDYLAAASTYFKNNAIFKNSTDAIYVVLTKSDLLHDEDENPINEYEKRVEYAKKHLIAENFIAFTNTLKEICSKHSINAGKLMVEPFSLGKVYFKDICNFDGTAAANLVDILMERIAGSKKSILDVFNK